MAITKVTNSLVATNAIQGTLIADNAITSVHIAQNQVTAVQIPDGSITSTQIAANSIDTAELVTGSIDAIHLASDSVTTAKILDANITTAKIANNAITSALIPDGSITATQLSSSTAPTFGNITTTGSLRGPASFTIDPAAVGDNTGTVVIAGSLQVDGTTTTVNSTTLSVADKNIVIASGAADAAAANDAGLTVTGASATLLYKSSGDKWSFNKPLDVTGTITANAGVVVDNFTLDGTTLALSSGDMTLDVAGDIILDADGGEFKFLDGGLESLVIGKTGGSPYIYPTAQDSDLIFLGNDGGSQITALTLDMSDVGTAHFNGHIRLGDNRTASFGADYDIEITSDGTHGTIGAPNGNLTLDVAGGITLDADGGQVDFKDAGTLKALIDFTGSNVEIQSRVTDADILFRGQDGSSFITALTLDMSDAGAATFNSTISSGAITSTGSGTTNATNSFLAKNSSNAELLKVRNDGVVLINHNYLYVSSAGGAYIENALRVRGILTNDGGNNLSIGSGGSAIEFNSKNFTSVGTISSGNITIGGTGDSQALIQMLANPTNGANTIHFGDTASGTSLYTGYINYAHDSNQMQFATNGGNIRMRLDSAGTMILQADGAANLGRIQFSSQAATYQILGGNNLGYLGYKTGGYHRFFGSDGAEDMRITSDGRLQFAQSAATDTNNSIFAHTNNYLYLEGGSSGIILADNAANSNRILIRDTNEIEFQTNGSERMSIDAIGNIRMGNVLPSVLGPNTVAGKTHFQTDHQRFTLGTYQNLTQQVFNVDGEMSATTGSSVTDAKASKGTAFAISSGQLFGPYTNIKQGTYRMSVRVRCNDASSAANAMRMTVYTSSMTRVTQRIVSCAEFETADEYQTFSIDFDVKASMANNLELYVFPLNSKVLTIDYVTITNHHESYSPQHRGIVTTPDTPAFQAYLSSGQSITSTETTVAFNTENYDRGGNHSNGVFTCPVAGVYNFGVNMLLYPFTSGIVNARFYQNSSAGTVVQHGASNNSHTGLSMTANLNCAVGDQITFRVSGSGLTSTNVYGGQAYWHGHLVG